MKTKFSIFPVLFVALLLSILFCCKKEAIKTAPTISISAVTNITANSAASVGEITSDGGATITARGVCWSTNQNLTTADNKTTDGSGSGSFSSSITGLTPGSIYYLKAYAINSVGIGYSSQTSLKTLSLEPVLTTTDLSAITSTTASSGGNITNDGGSWITTRGVCWSTNQNPTISNSITTDFIEFSNFTGVGNFTSLISGLSASTTYYLRSYVTNSLGTFYGNQVLFKTNHAPASLAQKSIVIIVDPNISNGIKDDLGIFISDLQNENYNTILKSSSFRSPEEVRDYLKELYKTTSPTLKGLILIGKIPLARQYFRMIYGNPSISPTDHTGVSTQFFSDLDGNFYKKNIAFPDSYSDHDGDIKSEIWVSILPYYKNVSTTVTKITQYLTKNHKYRTGNQNTEEGFLWVCEHYNATNENDFNFYINSMKMGVYSWFPFTNWGNVGLYIFNNIGKNGVEYAYANELQSDKYRFAVLDAHGDPSTNGQLTVTKVRSMNINPGFIFLGGCSTGNLDIEENIATEVVYSNLSNALITMGGSTSVGGLGTNGNGFYGKNIATAMLNGKCLGEAYLYHNNTPLISPWSESFELYNAFNIFIGDLSLTLTPIKH